MEIETIAILGNNFISKIIALSLKINHPQINVKIFTNGEDYKQQIISTQYIPFEHDYTIPNFFLKHCNITISDIFERTSSTVGQAVIFNLNNQEIIMPSRVHSWIYRALDYQCNKSNVLRKLTPQQKYLAFIEYLIQTNSNLVEIITKFPFTLHQNQKNLYHTSYRYNFPKREDISWQMLPGCYDLESLNILLDEKIAEFYVEKIDDVVINIDINETTITEDKNLKTIAALHTSENSFIVNFVINTGIDSSILNNFIESSDTLTEINDTIIFSGYTKQDFDFFEPAVYKNYIQDNQFLKTINFQNKSSEMVFSNAVDNINKEQNKFLINDLYNSNYIEFNVDRLGLNPVLNEDLATAIVYSDDIISTLGAIVLDSDNMYGYLNRLQNNWTYFRSSLKKFAYYLFENNELAGYESLKIAPIEYATNFQNKVPSFTVDLYNDITYSNSVEKEAYGLFEYILIAAQLGKVTNFDYTLIDDDIFKNLAIYLEFDKNENLFAFNNCNFDVFKNFIILETPDYKPGSSITEHNGITYENYIEFVPVTRVRIINDI